MPNDQTLSIVLKLRDEASAPLEAIAAKVNGITKTVGSSITTAGAAVQNFGQKLTSMGSSLRSAGTSMSIGLTAPIVALGTAVVKTSMDFQSSMELIRTQAGASQAEVDSMTKSVLALAKSGETGQGPQALAETLFHLESMGYRGAEALDLLKTSAEAADTGMANMEDVSNALGAAMFANLKDVHDANDAMSLLNATVGAGNMKMQDLASALGTGVLPSAQNFGLGLKDVGAALAVLTDNGEAADEAATRLRMTFSLIAAPTQKAQSELAKVGINATQLAEDMRKPDGLLVAMQDLKDHMDASGKSAVEQAQILSNAFGGGRTSAALMTLESQVGKLSTKYEDMTANAAAFNDAVQATHETNQYKLNAAMAKFQSILIDLGGTVMPIFVQVLSQVTGWLEKMAAWWDKLTPATQAWIVKGLAVLAVVGPLLIILGGLASALGAVFSGVGLVIRGVGMLITFLPTLWGAFIAGGPVVWAIVAAVVALAGAAYLIWKNWDWLKAKFFEIVNAIKYTWDAVVDWLSDKILAFENAVTAAINKIVDVYNTVKNVVETPFKVVGNVVGNVSSAVGNAANAVFSALPKFADGGIVPGPIGSPVPILAHGGERVVPVSKGAAGGGLTLNFHFHDVVAGDEGVRNIITRTVNELNRSSTLQRYAGA